MLNGNSEQEEEENFQKLSKSQTYPYLLAENQESKYHKLEGSPSERSIDSTFKHSPVDIKIQSPPSPEKRGLLMGWRE